MVASGGVNVAEVFLAQASRTAPATSASGCCGRARASGSCSAGSPPASLLSNAARGRRTCGCSRSFAVGIGAAAVAPNVVGRRARDGARGLRERRRRRREHHARPARRGGLRARPRVHAADERQLRRARRSRSSSRARSRTPSARAGCTPARRASILLAAGDRVAADARRRADAPGSPRRHDRGARDRGRARRRRPRRRPARARARDLARRGRATRPRTSSCASVYPAHGPRVRGRPHRPARRRQVEPRLGARRPRARRRQDGRRDLGRPVEPVHRGRAARRPDPARRALPRPGRLHPLDGHARPRAAGSPRRRCRRCSCSTRPARTSSSSRRSAPARARSA